MHRNIDAFVLIMKYLEPVVTLVGHLSFRNKLRISALIFGLPLLVAAGIMLDGLNGRVAALEKERAALAIQIPAHAFLADLQLYIATRQAVEDGATQLGPELQPGMARVNQSLDRLKIAFADHALGKFGTATGENVWFGRWDAMAVQIRQGDVDSLSNLAAALRLELDKLNEATGYGGDLGHLAGT